MWAGGQQHRLSEPAAGPGSALRHPAWHYSQQLGQSGGCPRSVSTGMWVRHARCSWWDGKLRSPRAWHKVVAHLSRRVETGNELPLSVLRPGLSSACVQGVWFCTRGLYWALESVAKAIQPIQLLSTAAGTQTPVTVLTKGCTFPTTGVASSTT